MLVRQQVFATPHSYFASAPVGIAAAHTVSVVFDQFDAGLGTLTGVSFAYQFVFSSSVVVQGLGGGSVGLSGPFQLFGQRVGGCSGSGSDSFTVQGSLPMTGRIPLRNFIGRERYSFDFLSFAGSGGSGPAGAAITAGNAITVSLSLMASSSVTVIYTCT